MLPKFNRDQKKCKIRNTIHTSEEQKPKNVNNFQSQHQCGEIGTHMLLGVRLCADFGRKYSSNHQILKTDNLLDVNYISIKRGKNLIALDLEISWKYTRICRKAYLSKVH